MSQMNTPDTEFYSILAIALIIFLCFAVVGLASFWNHFSQELDFLNREIRRNVGEERRYWIRKRRRLFLSILPFIKY